MLVALAQATLLFTISSAPGRWVIHAQAALSCGATSLHFAGVDEVHTNAVKGGSAKIEFVNESLCTTAGVPSFSSYWASVFGTPSAGNNIYQIGIDKCRGAACSGSNPVNTPYYFFAYGRDAGACTLVEPVPVKFGATPGSGITTFTIDRIPAPSGGYFYEVKHGGIQRNFRLESDLLTCWGGVDGVEIANEVLNVNDQSGGPNSNRQNFENPLWHNGSGWVSISRPAGADCDFIDQPANQKCQWAGDGSGKWWSWDTRWP